MDFSFVEGMKIKEVIKGNSGDYVYGFHCGLARMCNRKSFINKKGKVVLDFPEYDIVDDFKDNLAYAKNEDGKCGYIDTSGKVVIDFKFNNANYFNDGRALVKYNGELSFINEKGEIVIDNINHASNFNEGIAYVNINNKMCLIDIDGNIMADCSQYDEVGPFCNGLAIVFKGKKYGFIDKNGNETIPLIYDRKEGFGFIENFVDGVAKVFKNGKYGLIDVKGNLIVECKYDTYNWDSDSLSIDGKNYLIDRKQKKLVKCNIKYIGSFIEGLARANNGNGWGYIDLKGNIVLPFNYRKTHDFSEGMGLVLFDDGYGYVSYLE